MKFGEALIEAGALNRDQLAKALEMQKILGGRLGSNLLELGMLDEDSLLDHLGRFRATQTVRAEELKRIPTPVLRSIPRKLALRYRLVPYQVRGKTLYVASKNPGDALQEDEISFLTSFMVRTHLALEFHLDVALHRHFKAPLGQRFVALTRRLAAGSPGPGGAGAAAPAGTASSGSSSLTSAPASQSRSSSPALSMPTVESRGETALGSATGIPTAASLTTAPPTPVPPAPAPSSPALSAQAISATSGSVSSLEQKAASPEPPAGATPVPAIGPPDISFRDFRTPEPSMEFIELDADDLALLRGSESAVPVVPTASEALAAPEAPAVPVAPTAPVAPAFGPGIGELLPDDAPLEVASAPIGPVSEALGVDAQDEAHELEEPFGMPEDADLEGQLMWASRELQAADIRDEIGDVLLEFASAHYRRRVLVIRRKEELVGWMASGEGLGRQTESGSIRELGLAGSAPSVFFGLQEPDSFWLGPLPLLPANRQLVEALGGPAPRDCLVLPISLRSKIVGYLYVDNLDDGVAGTPVAEMKRLVAKAGLAFEVYILKNKIRMM